MKRGKKNKGIDIALSDDDTEAILAHIKEKGTVTIAVLGTFAITNIKPRTLYHNTAKKKITTAGYNKLKYTPSKVIKNLINE